MSRIQRAGVVLICLFITVLYGMKWAGVFINTTISYPLGLYKSHHISGTGDLTYLKGELVLFCPDQSNITVQFADSNNYLQHGGFCGVKMVAPFIKKVVGIPGDTVEITEKGVYVNSILLENSRRVNRHLKKLSFRDNFVKVLGRSEYWIMSDYDIRSFDSRYFGAVKRDQIKKRITPLLLFDTDKTRESHAQIF